jgi:hypothetical protein
VLLYSENTFAFQYLPSLLGLHTSTPNWCFNAITSICLNWVLKPAGQNARSPAIPDEHELEMWEHVWELIAGMDRLKSVKVTISEIRTVMSMVMSVELEKRILAPLALVKGSGTFEVEIPWLTEKTHVGPFVLTGCGYG